MPQAKLYFSRRANHVEYTQRLFLTWCGTGLDVSPRLLIRSSKAQSHTNAGRAYPTCVNLLGITVLMQANIEKYYISLA